jgi:hypothetical protein
MTPLDARVSQMVPVARKLLLNGIDPERLEFFDDLPQVQVDPKTEPRLREIERATEEAVQAYLVGMAVGLLLNAAMFLNRGEQ